MKKSLNPIRTPTLLKNQDLRTISKLRHCECSDSGTKQSQTFILRSHCLSPKNQGFTLIEALMGITVAGIILMATAPLLMFAVATRLQTAKAQQAMQLAQGEVNRIQALMAQGIDQTEEVGKLPPAVASAVTQLVNAPVPSTIVTKETDLDKPEKALEIDLDGDDTTIGDKFLVQTFRDQGIRFDQGSAANELAVFQMGVRVYSGLAKDNINNLTTKMTSVNIVQDFQQQQTRPLAVLYTEVSRSDLKFSLQKYRDYLNSKQTLK